MKEISETLKVFFISILNMYTIHIDIHFIFLSLYIYYISKIKNVDFPSGAVVKNLPVNAGDMGSSPGLGRSHMLRSN